MIQIEYESDDRGECLTECGHRPSVFVGSVACQECVHNCGTHEDVGCVYCAADEPSVTPTCGCSANSTAEEHWQWVNGLMETMGYPDIDVCEYLYKTAFVHGWKHCEEALDD